MFGSCFRTLAVIHVPDFLTFYVHGSGDSSADEGDGFDGDSLSAGCVFQNSPNDLQMLSDAPAHHVFVLLGPVGAKSTSLPDVLCVLQVCWGKRVAGTV